MGEKKKKICQSTRNQLLFENMCSLIKSSQRIFNPSRFSPFVAEQQGNSAGRPRGVRHEPVHHPTNRILATTMVKFQLFVVLSDSTNSGDPHSQENVDKNGAGNLGRQRVTAETETDTNRQSTTSPSPWGSRKQLSLVHMYFCITQLMK